MRISRAAASLVVLGAALAGEAALAAAARPAARPAAAPARPAARPAAATPAAGGRQAVTGPVAVYWMSAATQSGFGAMGMGGGGAGGRGRPNTAAMMSAMQNPNAFTHSLILQLGSSRRPTGPAQAEHDPPQTLGAGPVLPLLTPQAQPTHEERAPGPPTEYQQPHGRMLIFWGCGEHAGPNQPYVIDFAKLGQGGAQQFAGLMNGLGITGMQPPSPARNTTYGEWPNQETQTAVPPEGSLMGAHTIKGSYSPQIDFSLTAEQDFLPPIRVTTNEKTPSGAGALAWRPVDGSQAYFATMFGGSGQDQVVMWTSSQVQASAFGIPEYLSDGDISRLVANHTLMPASQTSCMIPAEAVNAAGQGGVYQLTAFGGETNLSYPPRPPAPQPWNIAWQVKVRYRSATGGIVGMDMARMMGGDEGNGRQNGRPNNNQSGQNGQQQQKPKRPNPFGGLGGLGNVLP